MTTFKEALAELDNNGDVVYHLGTPFQGSYITICGANYKHNKRDSEQQISYELQKAVKRSYKKLKQNNNGNNNNNNNVVSNMTNMAEIPQELDKPGLPSVKPYLDYIKQHGVATREYVGYWGKRCYNYRWVIRIEGNTYTYKGGHEF